MNPVTNANTMDEHTIEELRGAIEKAQANLYAWAKADQFNTAPEVKPYPCTLRDIGRDLGRLLEALPKKRTPRPSPGPFGRNIWGITDVAGVSIGMAYGREGGLGGAATIPGGVENAKLFAASHSMWRALVEIVHPEGYPQVHDTVRMRKIAVGTLALCEL